MLHVVDRIRFDLIDARRRYVEKRRADKITHLMAEALREERKNTGAATEGNLERRYGFTREEIATCGRKAVDRATEHLAHYGPLDPATG